MQPFCKKVHRYTNNFKINLIKVAYWSEMARNVIESEFQTSKMGAAGHFVKIKKMKVSYWSEMARNMTKSDFRTSKMAAGSHFVKKFTQK